MATVKNITRPATMEVLKDSTRCLTQMNKKQMLKIIKETGLLEQAIGLSKERKQNKGKEVKLVDNLTGEETILIVSLKLQEKLGKEFYF